MLPCLGPCRWTKLQIRRIYDSLEGMMRRMVTAYYSSLRSAAQSTVPSTVVIERCVRPGNGDFIR